jgi:hypothetical protein
MWRTVILLGAILDDPRMQTALVVGIFLVVMAPVWTLRLLRLRGIDRSVGTVTAKMAVRFGLSYTPKWPRQRLAPFRGLGPFHLGPFPLEGRDAAKHVAEGDHNDISVVIMYYYYDSFSRKRERREYEAVVFPESSPGVPNFTLQPRGWATKAAKTLGMTEAVTFEDSEVAKRFAAAYHVRGRAKDAIRSLFHSDVQEVFANKPGWYVESRDGVIVFWMRDFRRSLVDPERLPAFVAFFETACSLRAALVTGEGLRLQD